MKETPLDPLRLDMQALARRAATLSGEWPQLQMQRLAAAELLRADEPPSAVRWQARGELRARPGGAAQIWLHLEAHTDVSLQCQRCLMPVRQALSVCRSFLFVADEAEAERLDEDLEDDVLVLSRTLDLAGLVEDELILALPLVPRHEQCPLPLAVPAEPSSEASSHPFAVLASLRGSGGKG